MKTNLTVRTATDNGTRLEQLKTLAQVLADKLDDPDTETKSIASISREYRETIKEINIIEGGDDDNDDIDAIITRRKDR